MDWKTFIVSILAIIVIFISVLVYLCGKYNLIDEDDLKNPKTQDYISLDLNVTISYPSGVKTCTLSI